MVVVFRSCALILATPHDSDPTKAGLTAATAGVSSQLIVMAQEYNGKADAVEAVSKALPPVAVIVALAVCMLAFPPAVLAQPQSVGELLVGKAAFGDWRTDAPMVRRKITDRRRHTPPGQLQILLG